MDGVAKWAKACADGALDGGLSVAPDVRPDELFGPLAQRVGGQALRFRVADVLEGPPLRLEVEWPGGKASWALEGLEALAEAFNRTLAKDAQARAVVVLGEWEDALQWWCVAKARLPELLKDPSFQPRNRRTLARF